MGRHEPGRAASGRDTQHVRFCVTSDSGRASWSHRGSGYGRVDSGARCCRCYRWSICYGIVGGRNSGRVNFRMSDRNETEDRQGCSAPSSGVLLERRCSQKGRHRGENLQPLSELDGNGPRRGALPWRSDLVHQGDRILLPPVRIRRFCPITAGGWSDDLGKPGMACLRLLGREQEEPGGPGRLRLKRSEKSSPSRLTMIVEGEPSQEPPMIETSRTSRFWEDVQHPGRIEHSAVARTDGRRPHRQSRTGACHETDLQTNWPTRPVTGRPSSPSAGALSAGQTGDGDTSRHELTPGRSVFGSGGRRFETCPASQSGGREWC